MKSRNDQVEIIYENFTMDTTTNVWTNENDECLIEFVRSNEALYNVKSKEYRKFKLKRQLWNQIGDVLNKPGTDCQKRWFYVRDYYVRRRGKPSTGISGELSKKRCDLLSFLDIVPSARRASTSSVADDSSPERQDQEDEYTGDPLNSDEDRKYEKKRKSSSKEKRIKILEQIAQHNITERLEDDENDLFFKSMAKIVKRLPPYDQAQLRVQIGSLVGNAEIQCYSRPSRSDDQSYFSSTKPFV